MQKKLEDIADQMDLTRTNELFDITIKRTDFKSAKPIEGDEELKKARIVVQMGNIHINTAKTKIGALRLVGYADSIMQTKNAVKRKVRNQRKYGRRSP